ncbi:MAG: SMP-30/gluconolactonase/LRE family protein [Planctomycetes bacterium]|nr:SMP-30/gluconolactonase/LRE family protein [Planctomycetota bacterium]
MKRAIILTIVFALSATRLAAQDIPLAKILVEKDGWREVAKFPRTTYLQAEPSGRVILYDGQALGAIEASGKFVRLGVPMRPRDDKQQTKAASRVGVRYEVSLQTRTVWVHLDDENSTHLTLRGLSNPACLTLWPDEGHLVIGETDGAYLWAVRIEKDGRFGPGDRYYSLRTKAGVKMHVAAMTMDAGYLLYACTPLGIQVFDPTGRLSGVIAAPSKDATTAITIGGAKADELFVAAGDKIFARKIQGKAPYTLKKGS